MILRHLKHYRCRFFPSSPAAIQLTLVLSLI